MNPVSKEKLIRELASAIDPIGDPPWPEATTLARMVVTVLQDRKKEQVRALINAMTDLNALPQLQRDYAVVNMTRCEEHGGSGFGVNCDECADFEARR